MVRGCTVTHECRPHAEILYFKCKFDAGRNFTSMSNHLINDWTTGHLGNWLILFPSNLTCEQVYLSKFRENFPRTSKNEPICMLPRILMFSVVEILGHQIYCSPQDPQKFY